jgi:hypothetical protein
MCGADDAVVRAQARDTRLRLRPQVPGSPRGASCSCHLCHHRRYALSTHANPARPRAMVTHSLAPVCRVRCCIHSIMTAVVVSILAERAACHCCPRARPQCLGRHAGSSPTVAATAQTSAARWVAAARSRHRPALVTATSGFDPRCADPTRSRPIGAASSSPSIDGGACGYRGRVGKGARAAVRTRTCACVRACA